MSSETIPYAICKEIMVLAATPESMATEVKKCVKLANDVTVNREARTR